MSSFGGLARTGDIFNSKQEQLTIFGRRNRGTALLLSLISFSSLLSFSSKSTAVPAPRAQLTYASLLRFSFFAGAFSRHVIPFLFFCLLLVLIVLDLSGSVRAVFRALVTRERFGILHHVTATIAIIFLIENYGDSSGT